MQCFCKAHLLQRALRAVMQREPHHHCLPDGRRQGHRLPRLVLQLEMELSVFAEVPAPATQPVSASVDCKPPQSAVIWFISPGAPQPSWGTALSQAVL